MTSQKQNQNLLDNILRLQQWELAYLQKRALQWKKKHPPLPPDEFGCIMTKNCKSSGGYAVVTLRNGRGVQWHVRAYTLFAFLEKRLPSIKELSAITHPVASHTCSRGQYGCFNSVHIVFGEAQQTNMQRMHSHCTTIVTCEVCCHKQPVKRCTGHEGKPPCTVNVQPRVCATNPRKRMAEIELDLQRLKARIRELDEEHGCLSLDLLIE